MTLFARSLSRPLAYIHDLWFVILDSRLWLARNHDLPSPLPTSFPLPFVAITITILIILDTFTIIILGRYRCRCRCHPRVS